MTVEKMAPKVAGTPDNGNGKQLDYAWHSLAAAEVLQKLNVRTERGLSAEDAARRLQEYGPNQLTEAPPPTIWQLLWEQINDFVVMLLIVAAVVSLLMGDYTEATAIIAIVVLNAALGIVQERRAEQALAALKKLAAPEAHVIRDSSRQTVPANQLVPGDVVLLEAGNFVPADVRLVEAVNLRVEEAALTGESVPVQKDANVHLEADIPLGDRKNTTFMGTMVNYGRGRGIVVGTGMKTQIGLIAEMLQSVEQEETPLQKRLDQLGKTLGIGSLVVCGLVFLVGIFQRFDIIRQFDAGSIEAIKEMFLVAVSLAIAAVPEGLPAVVTISLALGMREMIKRHALIRRLSSVETLGSATTICSDKTGTLTQNEMTLTRMWVDGQFIDITGTGYNPTGEFQVKGQKVNLKEFSGATTALWVAALNNDAALEVSGASEGRTSYRMVGDPTEGAMIVAAVKAGARNDALTQAFPRVQEIPFDSVRKRMVTLHKIQDPTLTELSPLETKDKQGAVAVTVKGAPDIVLELCAYYECIDGKVMPLDETQRQNILQANDAMTRNALRVLGVAYRISDIMPDMENVAQVEKDLVFVGLVGMIDPARPEVPPALEKGRKAGIRTVMITGDYPNTARAIAEEIGLLRPGHQVLTGADLNLMDEPTLQKEVLHTDVFARVSPEHKMRIVEALRSQGQIVAMTGDGVNDAPSIKRADIGVAMGITGTDVAKESADMVLTDDNYASIVSAVEQGRIIYSNIRKFVYYLLSCNLAEIAIIFLGTLFTRTSPLTAIQLLWLNLITDGAPALALGTEKGDPDIMSQQPRPASEPIINRFMLTGIIVQTIAITFATLTAYFIGRMAHPGQPEFAETMAFVTLSFSELLRAFTARSERYPLLKIGVFNNRNMNLGVLSSLVLLLVVVYVPFLNNIFNTVPLGWDQWKLMLPLLFIPSLAAEITKYVVSRNKEQ